MVQYQGRLRYRDCLSDTISRRRFKRYGSRYGWWDGATVGDYLGSNPQQNLWPEEERNSALVNYIMGAAFITEGAIPFAAANPLKVIPPLAVSAGVAGALSMLFGIVKGVPHGGIFAML